MCDVKFVRKQKRLPAGNDAGGTRAENHDPGADQYGQAGDSRPRPLPNMN
jgi:hypothetical protein